VLQEICDRFNSVEIRLLPLTTDNPRQRILKNPRAALTGGTFGAAVLFLHPRHILGSHSDNVGAAIKDNNPVPTEKGTNLPLLKIGIAQLQFERGEIGIAAAHSMIDNVTTPTGKDNLRQSNLLSGPDKSDSSIRTGDR
jgi:hypothetical protein